MKDLIVFNNIKYEEDIIPAIWKHLEYLNPKYLIELNIFYSFLK